MMDFFIQLGYLGLFLSSFLASTILPFASEFVVSAMLLGGYAKVLILIFATLGNYLGASTNYFVGKLGKDFFFSRWMKVDTKKLKKAESIFKKYGAPILFFSWVPVIGDPLCMVPGILRLDFKIFSFWVILGKAIRYVILIWLTHLVIL